MAAPTVSRSATTTRTTSRADRKLSEVTKYLVKPDDIVDSDWPGIRNVCRNDLGIEFDRWQDGAGILLLAKNSEGSLAHTVGGFGMSICRQTGKTTFVSGAIFGLCVKFPGLLVIWSSHHSKTHMETFMAMQAFAARTKIAPFIDKVYTGSGDEEIRFVNGSRILFGARERGFGRGIPGVDVLVMDEGQILSIKAMRNMLATLNTSRLGLHIYAGTPPYPEDNCEVWMQMRDEALSGESTDSVWIEMGADDDADLDDVEQWMKANCSIPHRTPIQSMKRMRKMLDDIGFKHEALGIYDKVTGSEFDMAKWSTLIDLDSPAPDQVTLMLDVSPDRRWTTIAVAGEIDDSRALVMVESLKGTSGVMKRVEELLDQKDIIEVAIFNGGTARILKPDLTQAGIEFESLTAGDMAGAYGYLQESIRHGTVAHVDQPELNTALRHAKTRFLQTGEAETIDRRDNLHTNTSPAIAAAGALYRFGLLQSPMPVIL